MFEYSSGNFIFEQGHFEETFYEYKRKVGVFSDGYVRHF
jgi:hypothetical protein